jgi:outer membrane protein assembly factor BamB
MAGSVAPVRAQIIDTGETAEQARKNDGFNIRKEATKFNDALEDFARYRDKKAWELAFRSLETLAEAKRDGMVPAGDGFFVPSRQRVISSLTSLPPEGKQAFRLFYDAKAKQLLEKAQSAARASQPSGTGNTPAEKPVDEIATLREVYEKYFISSVGDRAADRLGDALFETGDFAGAAATWGAVLKDFPDTTLPKLRLHVKRCTALARATQWDRFDDALRQVRTEFAGERVTIGGKEVVAVEYLEQLRSAPATRPALATTTSSTKPTTGPTTAPAPEPEIPEPTGPVALPGEDTPAWQLKLADDSLNRKLANALNTNQWAAQFTNMRGALPASCTDGRRVYVNWFGIIFAADVNTGKMVWRNRKFSELGDKLQNIVNSGTDVDVYSATIAGGRLYVTGFVFSNLGNYQEPVRLVSMNPRDGKVNWSSTNGSLANWSFLGPPLVVGDVIYATARQRNATEVSLLALGVAKGELMWQVQLGTAQGGNNPYRGEAIVPSSALVAANASVYVVTNNGAVLAVDTVGRRVDWAYTFPAPPVMREQNTWFGGPQPMPKPKQRAAAFVAEGSTLYVKEQNGDALYAIDLGGPSLLWKRPIDRESTIARLDDGRLLVVGQDLAAIDTKGKAHPMTWSARLPDLLVRLTPVVSGQRVYAFAPRGIFEIDTSNGDTARILRGVDLDSFGGTLNRAPGRLIAVSNIAVTAYPVSDAPQPSGQAARPAN